MATEQYVVEIDWAGDKAGRDLPRLVGPFPTRNEADEWCRLNIHNGESNVAPLAYPYLKAVSR